MPTSEYTTIPAYKTALTAACKAQAGSRQVEYSWPGEQTAGDGMFLGDWRFENDIASIKAGRKRRDETYELQVHINAIVPNAGTVADAVTAELLIGELLGVLDGVLADDPQMSETVQWSWLKSGESITRETPLGTAKYCLAIVGVQARLV